MKSIVYILIAVFICSILIAAFPKNNSKSDQKIIIECVSNNCTIELLHKSAVILESRLNDYGLNNVDVFVNEKLSIIEISFEENINLSEVTFLLESKGQIEFFETYDRKEVIEKIGIDKDLALILNIPTDSLKFPNNSGVYGYCKESDKLKVELYLEKHYHSKMAEEINFYWGERPNRNGDFYLYILQSNPSLDNSLISECDIKANMYDKYSELTISFDKSGKSIWEDVTKRNVGKSIAIVLDKKVLFAPLLQTEITEGKCTITGDFSLNEISRIYSLIKNDKLPLEFEIKQ
jgi:hypothetical protein